MQKIIAVPFNIQFTFAFGNRKHSLIIIGSSVCPHCRTANEKAIRLAKSGRIDYEYMNHKSVGEAVKKAIKITGNNSIDSIPVYIVDGKMTDSIHHLTGGI